MTDDRLVKGATIEEAREMADDELEIEGWPEQARALVVLELSSGVVIYPSRDAEGNGGGALVGYTEDEIIGVRVPDTEAV